MHRTPLSWQGTVAGAIARYIANQGIERVYSLPGGHIKPLWHALDELGIRIVTARHEVAAVFMAQAEADLKGCLAVAIVTSGPGMSNAVTGMASAKLGRSPILVISASPPRSQLGMGALEEIDQTALAAPVCRVSLAVRDSRHVLARLDEAVSAAIGDEGPQGPAYVDFTCDLFREQIPAAYAGPIAADPRVRSSVLADPTQVERAARLIRESRRPVVIGGAAVREAAELVERFVSEIRALYLDTRSARGALPRDATGFVPAARTRAMREADLVVVPRHVVHPGLLGGWWLRSPSTKETPDEVPR